MGRVLVKEWAPIIDRWDAVGVYSERQRFMFRQLQGFYGELLAWEAMRQQAERG